jgi:hypothetical protein
MATLIWNSSILLSMLAILLAAWLVGAIHCSYHLVRAASWRLRQRAEKDALAVLSIPSDVKPVTAYAGVNELDAAQKRVLEVAPDYQGRYRAAGIKIAALPGLAVVFLSAQTIFVPAGGSAAVGLAFAESLLLFVLVAMVWARPQPTHDWVQSRMRAELLRREQYLRLVSVGPYLGRTEAEQAEISDTRIVAISESGLRQLEELTVPAEREPAHSRGVERPWIDAIWQTPETRSTIAADISDRMRSYLHYRIGKQLMWFTLGIGACERLDRRITWALKILVLAAVVVAAVHATLLFVAGSRSRPYGTSDPLLVALVAAVLPPFCSGLVAGHDVFGVRKLALSYRDIRRALRRYEHSLQSLINRLGTATADRAVKQITIEFQALVLHTEVALTEEMQRWVMLVYRPEFEAML